MKITLLSLTQAQTSNKFETEYRVYTLLQNLLAGKYLWIYLSNVQVYGQTIDLLIHHGGPGYWELNPKALGLVKDNTWVASCYSGRCKTPGLKFLFPLATTPLLLDANELNSCTYGSTHSFEVNPISEGLAKKKGLM